MSTAKLSPPSGDEKRPNGASYYFNCPGCGNPHRFIVGGGRGWTLSGGLEEPTVHPSIKCTWGENNPSVCHSWIRGGRIEFLADSTHELAGQTVELPPWEEG